MGNRATGGTVAWSMSRIIPTSEPEFASEIVHATAAQNMRARHPIYKTRDEIPDSRALSRWMKIIRRLKRYLPAQGVTAT